MFDRITWVRELAVLGLLGVIVAACASASPASGTPAPVTTPTPTASPTASPTVSPSASASMAPIADGDYVSGPITHAMAEAILNDPKAANGFAATTVFTLRFANSNLDILVQENGQDKGVGESGTYAFIDDHTMVLQTLHSACAYTFGFSLQGESIRWTVQKDSCGAADLEQTRVILELTTFKRDP